MRNTVGGVLLLMLFMSSCVGSDPSVEALSRPSMLLLYDRFGVELGPPMTAKYTRGDALTDGFVGFQPTQPTQDHPEGLIILAKPALALYFQGLDCTGQAFVVDTAPSPFSQPAYDNIGYWRFDDSLIYTRTGLTAPGAMSVSRAFNNTPCSNVAQMFTQDVALLKAVAVFKVVPSLPWTARVVF